MLPDLKIFFQELIQSWNSHDLDSILSHYSDDMELTSPIIRSRLNISNGTLKGKEKVREWWKRVLNKIPDFKLNFIDFAIANDDTVAFIQKSSHNQKYVVSIFNFNENGKICKEKYFD